MAAIPDEFITEVRAAAELEHLLRERVTNLQASLEDAEQRHRVAIRALHKYVDTIAYPSPAATVPLKL